MNATATRLDMPLDRFDLSDEQTIVVKVPSTDHQVPRLDSLCAVHSHDPTHVPTPKQLFAAEQNCAAPPQQARDRSKTFNETFNESFNDRVETG